jgi:hypothetical protein
MHTALTWKKYIAFSRGFRTLPVRGAQTETLQANA